MNIFTDIVFIFVFVFVLLHFELIDIKNKNIITQKILMFIYVTLFASILNMMKSIRRQLPIDVWSSVSDGLLVGIFAYAGHTLLCDLWYMPESRAWIEQTVDDTYFTLNMLLALFVVLIVTVGRSIKLIFSTELCV